MLHEPDQVRLIMLACNIMLSRTSSSIRIDQHAACTPVCAQGPCCMQQLRASSVIAVNIIMQMLSSKTAFTVSLQRVFSCT